MVMVGEIRDGETADIAIRAALTGHLVFSTLHTNDSASAMPRLMDMGEEPFLVASSVEGVLAQRLVRRICTSCQAPGTGCRECRQTGFHGRLGLYELLGMNADIRDLILERAAAPVLASAALQAGLLSPLETSGKAKVEAGLTTEQEVARVTKSH